LPPWVNKRLEKATELFTNSIAPKILLSGKGRDNFPITESAAMKKVLIKNGIQKHKILTEELSSDTLQNAYYSRVIHLDPLQIRSAIIITNNFHTERTELIFNYLFSNRVKCFFEPVDDDGIDQKLLLQRAYTESELMKYYRKLFRIIPKGDLESLHPVILDSSNKFYLEYHKLGEKLKNKMVLY